MIAQIEPQSSTPMKIPNPTIRLFAAAALFVWFAASVSAQTTFSRPSTTVTYQTVTSTTYGGNPAAPTPVTTTSQVAVTTPWEEEEEEDEMVDALLA